MSSFVLLNPVLLCPALCLPFLVFSGLGFAVLDFLVACFSCVSRQTLSWLIEVPCVVSVVPCPCLQAFEFYDVYGQQEHAHGEAVGAVSTTLPQVGSFSCVVRFFFFRLFRVSSSLHFFVSFFFFLSLGSSLPTLSLPSLPTLSFVFVFFFLAVYQPSNPNLLLPYLVFGFGVFWSCLCLLLQASPSSAVLPIFNTMLLFKGRFFFVLIITCFVTSRVLSWSLDVFVKVSCVVWCGVVWCGVVVLCCVVLCSVVVWCCGV